MFIMTMLMLVGTSAGLGRDPSPKELLFSTMEEPKSRPVAADEPSLKTNGWPREVGGGLPYETTLPTFTGDMFFTATSTPISPPDHKTNPNLERDMQVGTGETGREEEGKELYHHSTTAGLGRDLQIRERFGPSVRGETGEAAPRGSRGGDRPPRPPRP